MPCSFIDPISQKAISFTRNKTRQISSIVRPAIKPAPWLEAFVRSELCFTRSGFNPSKTDSELKVGTGGFLVKRKCQMTHHHHVAGYTFRASKKLPLYLPQSYHMVNFTTGRSHSLLEKFNLQHSGWLETERERRAGNLRKLLHPNLPWCSHRRQLPVRKKYLRKGKYWWELLSNQKPIGCFLWYLLPSSYEEILGRDGQGPPCCKECERSSWQLWTWSSWSSS